jgi:hypothetical protein
MCKKGAFALAPRHTPLSAQKTSDIRRIQSGAVNPHKIRKIVFVTGEAPRFSW